MHSDETRESRADDSVGGGNDSHADVNPPNGAGQQHSQELRQHHPSPVEATAPVHETRITTTLSDAQLDVFWAGIVANLDAARRMARKIVPRDSVDDVVHSAAVLYVQALQRQASRFPASEDELRGFFLKTVHHHAHDCVRQRVVDRCPAHSHRVKVPEPRVNGSTTPDRALDQVFARNDRRDYDAPAPVPRRPIDDLDTLYAVLRAQIDKLPPAQREIIDEAFCEGRTRAQIVQRRGISKSTYDSHLQAAYRSLRTGIIEVVKSSTDVDRPSWYDLVEILNERHAARQLRRTTRAKHKRSRNQHERSRSEGDASTALPERGRITRNGAASAASTVKSRGKRRKAEREAGAS